MERHRHGRACIHRVRRDGQGMYFNTQWAARGLGGGVGRWSDAGMMVKCTGLI